MTRPEEVLALPLHADGDEVQLVDGAMVAIAYGPLPASDDESASALVAMCNAYPLAVTLALAARKFSATNHPEDEEAMDNAIDAFLAHRQEPNNA